jgi:hypothetical protein
MSPRPPHRCRGDAGQVGGIEVLPFGMLTFVSATLLFVNAWGVIDAKFAVTAAARESVRAFIEADTLPEATAAAERRGTATLAAWGRDGDRSAVGSPALDATFGRCVRVSITVSYELPLIRVPFIGGFGSATPVESTHSALVDPFRSGLDGPSTC